VAYAVQQGVGLLEQRTPAKYAEAVSGAEADMWRSSMKTEIDSLEKMGAWKRVQRSSLPSGTRVMPCKWVYKLKHDENGRVTQAKSRLTFRGDRQRAGIDYDEVFASTGKYKTMRVGLAITAACDHELEQLDVPSAFLNAELDEDEVIYMEMPQGFEEEGTVLRLHKALYGLKQAPRKWQRTCSRFLEQKLKMKACVSDPCLFFKRSKSGRLILLFLFVDDMQASYHKEDLAEWNEMKQQLIQQFNTKDMGESKWILGMAIKRDRTARTITLDQEVYITKLLERFGVDKCRTATSPEDPASEKFPRLGKERGGATLEQPADRQRYMEMVGGLLYAAISTRPDIAHAVHVLTKHMQQPLRRHEVAAERVMRYLAGTRQMGLQFGRKGMNSDTRTMVIDISAYADADWANDPVDRKSVTGWFARFNGDVVSWASKKQSLVALSTCEAELYAASAAAQEILWLRGLAGELGFKVASQSALYGDNQSTIKVEEQGVRSERTKHVDVKHHFITECINMGDIDPKWVATTQQVADVLTKGLPGPTFVKFRSALLGDRQ
jgi:hypothetical protein